MRTPVRIFCRIGNDAKNVLRAQHNARLQSGSEVGATLAAFLLRAAHPFWNDKI